MLSNVLARWSDDLCGLPRHLRLQRAAASMGVNKASACMKILGVNVEKDANEDGSARKKCGPGKTQEFFNIVAVLGGI